MHSDKKGFTLLELLVVIAIIAILSVIGLTQLATARERARDSQRRIDLGQYQHVLTAYYDDYSQRYPLVEGDKTGVITTPDHSKTQEPSNATGIFKEGGGIIPEYFNEEVRDPLLGRDGHQYFYTANNARNDGATDYIIYTKMEIGGYYYAIGPGGVIADIPQERTIAPSCPGLAGTPGDDCTPPS